jgi:hypothetical protein
MIMRLLLIRAPGFWEVGRRDLLKPAPKIYTGIQGLMGTGALYNL